ncbi:hypothetical protein ACQEXR_19595, partial [Vibrio sp. TRT 2004]
RSQISMRSCLGTSNTSSVAPWDHGALTFRERMFSLIETAKLQQLSAYNWLREIVEHHMLKVDYQTPAFLAQTDVNS